MIVYLHDKRMQISILIRHDLQDRQYFHHILIKIKRKATLI
jgi:hypothetical protein